MAAIDLKNATLEIKDGASNSIEVKLGSGSLNWTETVNREYMPDRGNLDTIRNGDEVPCEVNMTFTYEYISGHGDTAALPTVIDALKQQNLASGWSSSSDDECEPYAVDLVFTNTPPCGSEGAEVLTFSDFRYETISPDTGSGQISVSGKCNAAAPLSDRTT